MRNPPDFCFHTSAIIKTCTYLFSIDVSQKDGSKWIDHSLFHRESSFRVFKHIFSPVNPQDKPYRRNSGTWKQVWKETHKNTSHNKATSLISETETCLRFCEQGPDMGKCRPESRKVPPPHHHLPHLMVTLTSTIHMWPENECVKAVESDHSFNSIEFIFQE